MADLPFLVVIETQRVKSYLFASRFLRETRGASLLLDRLNRIETRKILKRMKGQEIYLGGGSGRALFQTEDQATEFARAVRELYREATWNARVSVEVVARLSGESFPAWMARGVGESRKNKLERFEAVPLLGGRWIRPCTSCGQEPAEEILPEAQERHRLCLSCLKKREEVKAFYGSVKRNFDLKTPIPTAGALRKAWPDFILTTLAEQVERMPEPGRRPLLPRDFDGIGEVSRPRNYFAFLYADGNRMGETIRAMSETFQGDEEARQAYASFSAIVDRATREAAVEAVLQEVEIHEETTRQGERGLFISAEFVVAGGDDLILVVPAQAGLGVAERFLSTFQSRSLELQKEAVHRGELAKCFAPEGLTTSAGMILCHSSYPASQLVDMAAELMKLAKHRAADLAAAGTFEGTLDFIALPESGSEEIKRRRKREYEGTLPSGRPLRRTERPYTAREVGELRERILAFKDSSVPRSKLKALYAVLFRSLAEAQFEALRIRERLQATRDLERSSALRKLVDELPLFPFREDGNGAWSTPLSELIELYDFVHERPGPLGVAEVGERSDA
ncbi:MAG TPA: hypothetical protein VOA87_13310 [Thermoanaerobaculia bacterium]|nr:hypothetical protein [Thermoanaerobaculia bacterium]